jgi:hypothetical protein
MDEYLVRRWVRHGHDRLYVQTAAGRRLGYWDNKAQLAFIADEQDRDAFCSALEQHNGAASQPTSPPAAATPTANVLPVPDYGYFFPPTAVTTVAQSTDAAPLLPQGDLAAARPGQMAREQAVALRTAAPMRTLLGRVLGVKTDERAWRIGADGEESIGKQLAKLGDRWKSLHAVPVGDHGSDIDHVVIGPAGVYTINTKHHPNAKIWVGGNTLMVNGQRQPYVRNSRFEADRAAKFLTAAAHETVAVMAVIAFVNASDFTV